MTNPISVLLIIGALTLAGCDQDQADSGPADLAKAAIGFAYVCAEASLSKDECLIAFDQTTHGGNAVFSPENVAAIKAESAKLDRVAIADCVRLQTSGPTKGFPDKNFTDAAKCGTKHNRVNAVVDAWMKAAQHDKSN